MRASSAGTEPTRSARLPTAEWLTERLRESGTLAAGRVVSLEAEPLGTFSSELHRLRVRYEGAPPGAPERMIAKASSGARDRLGEACAHELRFYRELAPATPVRTPRCYGGAATASGDGLLLLEDVPGLETPDWLRGPDPAHARLAVAALARLHAAWSGRDAELRWVPSFADPALLASFERAYRAGWESQRDAWVAAVPDFAAIGDALVGRVASTHRRLAEEPTLLHGDAHAENLPLQEGADVVALDWAGPRVGSAGVDVGFFVAMSHPPEARARVERELVGHHDAVLRSCGGRPTLDPWLGYRRGVLRRVTRLVGIAPGWPPEARSALQTLFQRCAVAAVELEAGELVE